MKISKLTNSILAMVAITALAVPGIVFAQTNTAGAIAHENAHKVEAPGIVNVSLLEGSTGYAGSRVSFGGETQASAMPWLKSEGFGTVINLRLASEDGATVKSSEAAATAIGIKYVHLPFDPKSPDPDIMDKFTSAVGEESNQPVYIHCHSASRAAALWMISRVQKDGWAFDDAANEAKLIAEKPEESIAFAKAYLKKSK